MKSTPLTLCIPLCKCPWALKIHVRTRGGCTLTRMLGPGRDRVKSGHLNSRMLDISGELAWE